jgi:7-carboxy-7-deazaguanine synthase
LKLANHNGDPEIFHSLQGEGPNRGHPCVFVRLSLCNLHCSWCDTDYTWNWTGTKHYHRDQLKSGYTKFDQGKLILERTPGEVVESVLRHKRDYVVITGGEPLMQQKELVELLRLLRDALPDGQLEIETNGTIVPIPAIVELVDQLNVSPKLSSSGNSVAIAQKPTALHRLAHLSKSVFKFVITDPADLAEVVGIVDGYNITRRSVYLVPEGITVENSQRKAAWLSEECKELGFAFCDRLNISLYGNARAT